MNDAVWLKSGAQSYFRILRIVLVGFPFFFLVFMYVRFSVDIPFLDQWELVPLLEKMDAGALGFRDLWAQHNEHRLVFPKALMLALAWCTQWRIGAELAVNFVLGAGFFAALAWRARRDARERAHAWCDFASAPLLALLCLSLAQWQNWFLGWQMQVWMSLLALFGVCAVLSAPAPVSWRWLLLACGCGVLATYSFANGMLVWPIGLALLIAQGGGWRRVALWATLGVLAIGAYLHGYATPDYHPAPTRFLAEPLGAAHYLLAWLGNPLAPYHAPLATALGALGLAVFATAAARGLRDPSMPRDVALFWLALGAYALGSALLTAVARVDYGAGQAMSSRYVTLANLLWAANIAFAGPLLFRRWPRLGAWSGIVIALLLVLASLYGAYRWTERYNVYMEVRAELMYGDDPAPLHWLHPAPEVVLERRDALRRMGLGVFRAP